MLQAVELKTDRLFLRPPNTKVHLKRYETTIPWTHIYVTAKRWKIPQESKSKEINAYNTDKMKQRIACHTLDSRDYWRLYKSVGTIANAQFILS